MTEATAKPEPKAPPVSDADQQLDALESQAAALDVTPEQQAEASQVQEKEVEEKEAAQAAAAMTVGVMAQLLEILAPVAAVDEPTQKEAVAKLEPLFEKYGVNFGTNSPWKAEIDAAVFFGVTGYTCWKNIQAQKEADAAKAKQEKEGGQGGSQ